MKGQRRGEAALVVPATAIDAGADQVEERRRAEKVENRVEHPLLVPLVPEKCVVEPVERLGRIAGATAFAKLFDGRTKLLVFPPERFDRLGRTRAADPDEEREDRRLFDFEMRQRFNDDRFEGRRERFDRLARVDPLPELPEASRNGTVVVAQKP